jgi:hypothetical protein
MTTTPLHIALKKAVDDLGIDILKSPMLVNVLTDYHAFDEHDLMLKELVVKLKQHQVDN